MLKFLQDLMDWWHGVKPTVGHDFVDPPVVKQAVIEPVRKMGKSLARQSIIDEAREKGLVVYEAKSRPDKPTLAEALEIVREFYHVHAKADGTFSGEHRGRSFTAAPNSKDAAAMQPPDLRRIVEQLKALACPFLLVAVHREIYQGAAHGWCNGSNFGRIMLEEIARCAELNIKQELAKCGHMGESGRGMPTLGQGRYRLPR